MAVIVREETTIRGRKVIAVQYLPRGILSRDNRLRAERLDDLLKEKMPAIAREMHELGILDGPLVQKWHSLGVRLRAFADDPSLVDAKDRDTGLLWDAIRWHCPKELLAGSQDRLGRGEEEAPRRQRHKYDHFHYCYEAGKFEWEEFCWLERWSDWISILESPGLIRDLRAFRALADEVRRMRGYPSRRRFRSILGALRQHFRTRQYRDSSVLSPDEIQYIVSEAVSESARSG